MDRNDPPRYFTKPADRIDDWLYLPQRQVGDALPLSSTRPHLLIAEQCAQPERRRRATDQAVVSRREPPREDSRAVGQSGRVDSSVSMQRSVLLHGSPSKRRRRVK